MRERLVTALALALPVLAGAQIPESVDPASIPNYAIVKPGLAAAGQPTPEALRSLKERGFKTVVNLRAETEPGVKEEEAIVRGLGLDYALVPITPSSFSQEHVDRVAKILDDPKAGPVLLHCGSANRVGAVWAVIQAQRGKSYEEAEAEGRRIGLTSPAMVEAVKRVLAASGK
jgi:uncharacterized protein (TIGR01244 family)